MCSFKAFHKLERVFDEASGRIMVSYIIMSTMERVRFLSSYFGKLCEPLYILNPHFTNYSNTWKMVEMMIIIRFKLPKLAKEVIISGTN